MTDVDLGESPDLADRDLTVTTVQQDLANPDFAALDLAGVDLLGVDLTGGCVAGTACGGAADIGGCRARIVCVGMTPVCRGTYVDALNGDDSNAGTRAAPLKTLLAAQNNATLIGGGADVCACAATTSTWNEDLTMREGQSLLGGYQCGSWARDIAQYTTRITDTVHSGVKFPAGITVATALDGFTVRGHDEASGTSAAISVVDSSPRLDNLTVQGGAAPTSYALHVIRSGGAATASPTVAGGTYRAGALSGGTEHVAHLEGGAGGSFTDVSLLASGGSGGTPVESVALRCNTCGRVGITAVNTNPLFYAGAATMRAAGLWVTGNANLGVQGTQASAVRFEGSSTSGTSRGIYLENCSGTATFGLVNVIGGIGATATNVGVDVTTGAVGGCAVTFTGSGLRGCGTGATCIGLRGNGFNANITANDGDITGSAQNQAATASSIGVQCLAGACSAFNRVLIDGGRAPAGAGVQLDNSDPTLNANLIIAPSCSSSGPSSGVLSGLHMIRSRARVINNVISDAACSGSEDVVRFEKGTANIVLTSAQLINNTIEYTRCASCGDRRGLSVKGVPMALGSGPPLSVNNNIIRHRGTGGNTWPVFEYDTDSNMQSFSSNDLYDPTAQALFRWHGSTDYTITDVNDAGKLSETNGKNLSADPLLNASWHLMMASPCRNAGIPTLAPQSDFDDPAQARPNVADTNTVDIGADEYYP